MVESAVGRDVERYHDRAGPGRVTRATPQRAVLIMARADGTVVQVCGLAVPIHKELRPLPSQHPQLLTIQQGHAGVVAPSPGRPLQAIP